MNTRQSIPSPGLDLLQKSLFVLLAAQIAVMARMAMTDGVGNIPSAIGTLVVVTAVLIGANRRMAADLPNPPAMVWIVLARGTMVAILTLATLGVALHRLLPEMSPQIVETLIFPAMWIVIALKGAAVGKLKPNRHVGLLVPWTCNSRLAWDKGHRMLGRVLFWGGMAGLIVSTMVPPLTSLGLWLATIACAVVLALIESRNAWRTDPDRSGR